MSSNASRQVSTDIILWLRTPNPISIVIEIGVDEGIRRAQNFGSFNFSRCVHKSGMEKLGLALAHKKCKSGWTCIPSPHCSNPSPQYTAILVIWLVLYWLIQHGTKAVQVMCTLRWPGFSYLILNNTKVNSLWSLSWSLVLTGSFGLDSRPKDPVKTKFHDKDHNEQVVESWSSEPRRQPTNDNRSREQ